MEVLPRNKSGVTHLWDTDPFQLGDWLDPMAPPDKPWKSPTDATMVANMFLLYSLNHMSRVSAIFGKTAERISFEIESKAAREQFYAEYVTRNGRIV
ncbi:hypothetical protein BJY00DRAFT_315077 [Aspergillus carlsbadensis]|nr:hypothetical protein BJY00DRAFT_315077 [Aspergillus carlsbadensis]